MSKLSIFRKVFAVLALLGLVLVVYLVWAGSRGLPAIRGGAIINKWIVPYFGGRILDEIEPEDIGNFISHLDSKQLSSKYQVNAQVVLKLMFDVAVLNRFMKSNPVRPKLHVQQWSARRSTSGPWNKGSRYFQR